MTNREDTTPVSGSDLLKAVERVTAALRLWATSGQPDDTLIYSDNFSHSLREIAENGGVTCISDPDYTIGEVKAFLSALSSQAEDRRTLRTLLDNVVVAQSLSREIREAAHGEARSYIYQTRTLGDRHDD